MIHYYQELERMVWSACAACDCPEPVSADNKAEIKRRVYEMLRIQPEWRPQVSMQTISEHDGGDFLVQKQRFESWPRIYGSALLYLPKRGARPWPAMLLNHGHALQGKFRSAHQTMAQLLAAAGVAVLVPDVMGLGERQAIGHAKAYEPFTCGTTVCGLIVLEALGYFDYLRQQPCFDRNRIGLFGNSGGGQTTMFMCGMAYEDIALAAPSGFPHTFEYNARKERHLCPCTIFPGVLKQFEMRHLLGCLAPKPLLVAAGRGDTMIPRDVVLALHHRLQETYRTVGQPDAHELLAWNGPHSWETPECFYGITNFILRKFGLPTLPEGPLPKPMFPEDELTLPLPDDAIDMTALAEHLTGNQRRPAADIIDVFPPKHIPTEEWKQIPRETLAILAQIASFVTT